MLPEAILDFRPTRAPVLQLTVRFRPGATPVATAADLHVLWKALNDRDLGDGGAGLTPDGANESGAAVQLVYRPVWEVAAWDRFTKLVAAINAAEPPSGLIPAAAIERCEAAVLTP